MYPPKKGREDVSGLWLEMMIERAAERKTFGRYLQVHFRSIARAEVRLAGDARGATAAYMSMPQALHPR